ncbi:MAG: TOTE conflict system archaeo-eukaryotic primase domain-containing protein [Solirubrobacteraceae bacterium]
MPHGGELQRARDRLIELDRERATLLRSIAELEGDDGPDITTAEGRVRLFASLFRGRPDVFATRWESTRTPGRSGWAPRCANEWQPGRCFKPKVKCADCADRRFVPLTHTEVRRHLEGRQTVGIYPLLADETCWLVAVDLDGIGWRDDVSALREAAADLEIPVSVERSRSGDGAHAWIFFEGPVPACAARSLASLLLTQAMTRRSIPMDSYDRLFPNQATMPAGGFGNLVALPLQYARRADGCTVFLDEGLQPYPDQWSYLATVRRLDREHVTAVVGEDARSRGMLGFSSESARPQCAARPLPGPTGGAVTVSLAARVGVSTHALSPQIRDRLRRTAAFANPEFFERERARLSTHETPRVIACHEELSGRLVLPRGCLDAALDILDSAGIAADVTDSRSDGTPIDAQLTAKLRPAQRTAVAALAAHDMGVLVAPPGAGKTVIAAALIAHRARSTLVLVHRRPLLEQWVARLAEVLDVDTADIGTSIGKPGACGIDVAMIQSVARKGLDQPDRYGHIVVDECHHVPAFSAERVLRDLRARSCTGLTATPERRDGHHPILAMQCGPVRHTITATVAVETAARRVLLAKDTRFDATLLPPEPGIQEILGAVAGNEERSRRIALDALAELREGRYPLILTERREHLHVLATLISEHTDRLVVLHGGLGVRARRAADAMLATDGPRVILATGRFIGEGFDDPRLDTLMLALPIAWKGTTTQYAGRLHRHHDAKHDVRIIDYVDHDVPVLRRMFAKRQKTYARLGYASG